MALQAKLPFLDFSDLKDQKKDEYFDAVRAGLEHDYRQMEEIFSNVVTRSLKSYGEG
jgi:cell filamentation protein